VIFRSFESRLWIARRPSGCSLFGCVEPDKWRRSTRWVALDSSVVVLTLGALEISIENRVALFVVHNYVS
jgi:hypothetical protein